MPAKTSAKAKTTRTKKAIPVANAGSATSSMTMPESGFIWVQAPQKGAKMRPMGFTAGWAKWKVGAVRYLGPCLTPDEQKGLEARQVNYFRGIASRDSNALKAQIFNLTTAQSRYVRQDNAIRKLLAGRKGVRSAKIFAEIERILDLSTMKA